MADTLLPHCSLRSPCVHKVVFCAHELGLVEQLDLMRYVATMQKSNPAIMTANPLSNIPTLARDDGSTLFNSTLICEYLSDLARRALISAQGRARWHALRWRAFGAGMLNALGLWRNERERALPLRQLINAVDAKVSASTQLPDTETKSLAAAPFSIGTPTVGCALGCADYRFRAPGWREISSRLAQWAEALFQRSSFQTTESFGG
jgi:glutathione S-transferase